jgi:hypothetical protein
MAKVGEQVAILEELRAADPQAVDFRQRADFKAKEFQENLSELRKREFIETHAVGAMGPEDVEIYWAKITPAGKRLLKGLRQ